MNRVIVGIFLLLLTACAAGGPRVAKYDPVELRAQLIALPGLSVTADEPLQFSYPEQSMFGAGAVLPLPGGVRLLDPLANFFQRNSGLNWKVDVRVQTEHGSEYDQLLAEKRSELLATYLLSKGVSLEDLYFHPEAAAGQPLVFTLTLPQPVAKQ